MEAELKMASSSINPFAPDRPHLALITRIPLALILPLSLSQVCPSLLLLSSRSASLPSPHPSHLNHATSLLSHSYVHSTSLSPSHPIPSPCPVLSCPCHAAAAPRLQNLLAWPSSGRAVNAVTMQCCSYVSHTMRGLSSPCR